MDQLRNVRNEDENSQGNDVLDRRVQSDGLHDISSDEDLQPKKQRATHASAHDFTETGVATQRPIAFARHPTQKSESRKGNPPDNDSHPQQLEHRARQGDPVARRRQTFNSGANAAASSGAPSASGASSGGGTVEGKAITIGFSAPEADHGWIGAITNNAKSQAGKYSEVSLEAVEGTNDVNQQISQVETLISKKVDVIVILPFDGKALTATALKAQLAGIPVVNLDRVFADPRASRTWIGGDNYGMGVAASTTSRRR